MRARRLERPATVQETRKFAHLCTVRQEKPEKILSQGVFYKYLILKEFILPFCVGLSPS
jgi:hypothetical protein